MFVQFCASAVLLGCVVSSASADMTNFRDWVDANGMATNSTSNLWYGTSGLGGPMMASTGSGWNSPGYPVNTPMIGGAVAVGSNGGAAGTATFEGLGYRAVADGSYVFFGGGANPPHNRLFGGTGRDDDPPPLP